MKIYCTDKTGICREQGFSLLKEEVHIYYIDITHINFDTDDALITPGEKMRSMSFRQKADAQRFLAGRIYSRKIVAGYRQAAPQDIAIQEGKNKKPYALHQGNSRQMPFFNISHSGNIVMIAVAEDEVGVDVEQVKNGDFRDISLDVLSAREQEVLNSAEIAAKAFCKFWTRKEAVLKATGAGLIDYLPELEVLNGVNEHKLYELTNQDLHILSFEPCSGYVASVCYLPEKQVRFVQLPGS